MKRFAALLVMLCLAWVAVGCGDGGGGGDGDAARNEPPTQTDEVAADAATDDAAAVPESN